MEAIAREHSERGEHMPAGHHPGDQPDQAVVDRRSVDERREQLLDAAITVLATEGLNRATTRRITDQAGLALGAFHYAFRSKDELLAAVIERIGDRLRSAVAEEAADEHEDLASVAIAMLHRFWAFMEEQSDLHLALYELTVSSLREPALRGVTVREYDRYVDLVAELLDDVETDLEGVAREDLARYIVATMDGLVLQALIHDDRNAARRRLTLEERALEGFLHAGAG